MKELSLQGQKERGLHMGSWKSDEQPNKPEKLKPKPSVEGVQQQTHLCLKNPRTPENLRNLMH